MKKKLALCPFCTSSDLEIVHFNDSTRNRYFVQCHACDAAGGFGSTEDDAIFSWNNRPFAWQDISTTLPPKDFYVVTWDRVNTLAFRRTLQYGILGNWMVKLSIEKWSTGKDHIAYMT